MIFTLNFTRVWSLDVWFWPDWLDWVWTQLCFAKCPVLNWKVCQQIHTDKHAAWYCLIKEAQLWVRTPLTRVVVIAFVSQIVKLCQSDLFWFKWPRTFSSRSWLWVQKAEVKAGHSARLLLLRRLPLAGEPQNCSSCVWINPLWSSTVKGQEKLVWSLWSWSYKAKLTLKQRKCKLSLNWGHWHSAKTRTGEWTKITKCMCVCVCERDRDMSMWWKEIVFHLIHHHKITFYVARCW